jgi:hypothetical protein
MVVEQWASKIFRGLTSDTKPTGPKVVSGSLYIETNGPNVWIFNGAVSNWEIVGAAGNWDPILAESFSNKTISGLLNLLPLIVTTNKYSIYKTGNTINCRNNRTGAIDFSDTGGSIDPILTSIIGATTPAGTQTVIEIGEGDFKMTNPFTAIDSTKVGNIKIKGQGPGITNLLIQSGCVRGFLIEGAVAVGKALTANAVSASYTVTVSAANAATFAKGDYVLLRSDRMWIAGPTSAAARQGEIHRVKAVNTGTGVITFYEVLMDDYATTDNSVLASITMLQNITLEDFTIKPIPSGYTGQTGPWLRCNWIDNLQLKNLEVSDSTAASSNNIIILNCINSDLDVITKQSGNYPFVELPTTGQYGIYIGLASQHVRLRTRSSGQWRHSMTIGGINTNIANAGIVRDLTVTGSAESGYSTAFDTHADGEGIVFENCNVSSIGDQADNGVHNTGLMSMRAKDITISGCNLRMVTAIAIRLSENASNTVITGNTIHNVKKSSNNTNGIAIYLEDAVTGIVITGNSFYDCDNGNWGLMLAEAGSHDMVFSGNAVIACGPLRMTDCNNVVITGNRFNNGARRALYMLGTSTGWVISGNNAAGSAASTLVGTNTITGNVNL